MEFRGPPWLLSVGRGHVLLVRIGVRQCAVKGPSQVKNLAKKQQDLIRIDSFS